MVKLNMDIKETYGGQESILLTSSNQKFFPYKSYVYEGKKFFQYELRISNHSDDLYFNVNFQRSGMTDDIMNKWNPSKITGFSVEWYFKGKK